MTEQEIRALVAETICLRNSPEWRDEDNHLIETGAALNSQVDGADIRERSAELRELSPGQLLLQCDIETGSHFVEDGTAVPPQMALGAADNEQLAFDWGYAVGLEARRLGVDTTCHPILDVNTNPDNPIINVRAFGEDPEQVGRLGAAMTRGFLKSGLHPGAAHWPGHGDVAVDSHISMPTVEATRDQLESIHWLPYRMAREAGLQSAMTGHLLVPAVDPHSCGTVSHALITEILRKEYGYDGVLFTDSLGMEGLRRTIDSAQAAWMAIAAGHDQVLIDYKRSPIETVEVVVAACMDGSVPEDRLRDAAARVRALKARIDDIPPLPPDAEIHQTITDMARRVAEASVTLSGPLPAGGVDPGEKPLLVICDDLQRYGVGFAEEKAGQALEGTHPLDPIARSHFACEVLVCNEDPSDADLRAFEEKMAEAHSVIGATFAHIISYKGGGVRLPSRQVELWRRASTLGKLRAMMLFESPYALSDLPPDVPVVVGYGGEDFTCTAAVEALLGKRDCPGTLPVTVARP